MIDEQEIIDMYCKCHSGKAVSDSFGIDRDRVYRILRKNGIRVDGCTHKNGRCSCRPNATFCHALMAMLFTVARLEQKEIAAIIGCSYRCVANGIYRDGVSRKSITASAVGKYDTSKVPASEIARREGLSQSTVSSFIRDNGLPSVKRSYGAEISNLSRHDGKSVEDYWREKVTEAHGDMFDVVDVYKRGGAYRVEIRCKTCGQHMERLASKEFLDGTPLCNSSECRRLRWFEHDFDQQTLRLSFSIPYKHKKDLDDVKTCIVCGSEFTEGDWGTRGRAHRACSRKCQDAILNNYGREKITIPWRDVAEHYGTMDCHICGRPVDPSDYSWSGGIFRAGPNYPSTDHVIPWSISHDGSIENSRLAHVVCNSRKGVKLKS